MQLHSSTEKNVENDFDTIYGSNSEDTVSTTQWI
jgi:hypothetical protein